MKYISTRGGVSPKSFSEILLEGLAPDGGLYMPRYYPQVSIEQLKAWSSLSYRGLAFEIFSLYIDDIPKEDLRAIVYRTYTKEIFGTDEITPVKMLKFPDLFLEGLSNGPTLAFKDIALQFVGNLFEYELARRGEELNILGATSGDTGSAAEYAMLGKNGIRVFMLSPNGRMSPFQQAQMYSLNDPNIHNIAINGVFDDCQDIVKAISKDAEFKSKYNIGTVNSINWARILAQVVYYFYGYLNVAKQNIENSNVSFVVPSGNFGNVCAGHVARMMGLPIKYLIVATNENDILDEFFRTGHYKIRSQTVETSSPSMDICKASNFERFIFDLLDRDTEKVKLLFNNNSNFTLTNESFDALEEEFGFLSGKSNHSFRLLAIKECHDFFESFIDPHTADGIVVSYQYLLKLGSVIVLETAQAAKFEETIYEAIRKKPIIPESLIGIEKLPKYFTIMDPIDTLVKEFIVDKCKN
jgi:threonine synthase